MEIYLGDEIPKLTPSKCSVIQAELKTGIVLTNEGSRFLNNSNDRYFLIFDSFEDAKEFCLEKVKENPTIECCIYDHLTNFVEFIRF